MVRKTYWNSLILKHENARVKDIVELCDKNLPLNFNRDKQLQTAANTDEVSAQCHLVVDEKGLKKAKFR